MIIFKNTKFYAYFIILVLKKYQYIENVGENIYEQDLCGYQGHAHFPAAGIRRSGYSLFVVMATKRIVVSVTIYGVIMTGHVAAPR